MPIPSNELFEAFLRGCSLVAGRPEGPSVLFHDGLGVHPDGTLRREELYLSYPDIGISLDSVVQRIESELRARGTASSPKAALAALGIIVASAPAGGDATSHANACLAATCAATHRFTFVVPGSKSRGYQIDTGRYLLGDFDPQPFSYWSGRAKCAWPDDVEALSGKWSCTRKGYEVQIVDWARDLVVVPLVDAWGESVTNEQILDSYFQAVACKGFKRVEREVHEDWLMLEAGALMNVNVGSFFRLAGVVWRGLFVWRQGGAVGGWALATNSYPLLNAPVPDLVQECRSWLADLGFENFTDRPVDRSLSSYAKFLQRAHALRVERRLDEAFLHFAIGLDLLLGSKDGAARSVATRAAVLTSRQDGVSLQEQVRRCSKLYDARSRYVHEGASVSKDDLDKIEFVCSEVLWSLAVVSGAGSLQSADDWLTQVDFAAAAEQAGQAVDADLLAKIGVPADGERRRPPNRIES